MVVEPAAPLPAARRARRRLPRWAVAALAALLAVLVSEGVFRLLLFGPPPFAALGARLRRPGLYADPDRDELWWALASTWNPLPAHARRPGSWDPLLGWRDGRIEAGTYAHRHEARVGARRPVLLYGDSFAACHGQAEHCWDVQLEADPLGRDFALLNYGVSGYGLDQISLLVEASLERWLARRPLVLIGVLVDDDLVRVGHRLREQPKPWFELAPGAEGGDSSAGGLVYHAAEADTVQGFLALHPPRAWSWIARRLLASRLAPEAWSQRALGHDRSLARAAALSRALLRRLTERLAARGVEHVFVLFHGRSSIGVPSFGWEEPLLLEELARAGVPWVSTRTAFQADMRLSGRKVSDYFEHAGRTRPHYGAEGMRVAFQALRQALVVDGESAGEGGGAGEGD